MHIYLDTRDLITLVEKRSPKEAAKFNEKLRQSSSELIFSLNNISEISAPLLKSVAYAGVMSTLNRLEEMPHLYLADARIVKLELQEAVSAFLDSREYATIVPPFVPRFDYVVSAFNKPPTKDYLQYGLAHTVYELWHTDKSLLINNPCHAKHLRAILDENRKRDNYKNHESNYPNTIAKDLLLYNISFPIELVDELAKWIYRKPSRCPSHRLGYEVFHKLLRNLTDGSEDSDMMDFAHIYCVPYVDAATLDNRMRGYLAQVDHSIGTEFSQKVYQNIVATEELL